MSLILTINMLLALVLISVISTFTVPDSLEHYSKNAITSSPDSCREVETPITQELMELKNCPGCLNAKLSKLSADDIHKLKMEIWKQEVLKKLGLKVPPCVTLPKPPLQPILAAMEDSKKEKSSLKNEEDEENHQDVVVFANENVFDDFDCPLSAEANCSIHLQFSLPGNVDLTKLASMDLWIYKKIMYPENWLTVEIANEVDLNEFLQQPRYVEKDYENTMSGWLKSNLQVNLSSSVIDNPTVFKIKSYGARITTSGEEKPFLILHLKNQNNASNRNRRSLDCEKDSKTCCKETWLVDFVTIGWEKWILHPVKYFANYCKGTCSHDISIHRYFHSEVKYSYLKFNKFNKTAAETLGINMCCTPSKLSPLSLIYRDANGTVYRNILENMIVEECECS